MDTDRALAALAALAQKHRLAIFRLLVGRGPAGACPGDIATSVALAPATLSFHLKSLLQAGLIDAEQQGRSITYRANIDVMQALVGYLGDHCCDGEPSRCMPAAKAPRTTRPRRRVAG